MSTTANRRKPVTERYADSWGIYFDEYRSLLPSGHDELQALMTSVQRIKDDQFHVLADMHSEFGGGGCWLCGKWKGADVLEAHHVASGARKSDERTNIIMACRECHKRVQSDPRALPEVCIAKWRRDPGGLIWVRLALLVGRHLPDLITKEN